MHKRRRPFIPRNRKSDRTSPLYTSFCKKVYKRDGGRCVCCKSTYIICAHHLNGWSWYTQGRYDEYNAVTLCKKCHDKFHEEYGKTKNTREQFEEFIRRRFNKSLRDIL